MKHYFLVAKDVGDLTRIFCAALEEHHGKSAPVLNRLFGLARPPPPQDPGLDRFHRRQRPHQRRRRPGLRPRSGQPRSACSIWPTATTSPSIPMRCSSISRSLRPDRRRAARRPGSQSPVRRDPRLAPQSRGRAPPHERDRRARQLHPGFRPDRRDDAVQHVSPLHGRRAPHPGDRHARRASSAATATKPIRSPTRLMADIQDRDVLYVAHASCTTSPRAGPRIIRIAGARVARRLVPAPRARHRRRPRPSPGWSSSISYEHDRPVARPQRPQDHPRFRRDRADRWSG